MSGRGMLGSACLPTPTPETTLEAPISRKESCYGHGARNAGRLEQGGPRGSFYLG